MGLGIIAEAVLRIEHKLDVLLNLIRKGQDNRNPMHFIGHQCPVCDQSIDYLIDFQHNVVTRRCGCKTGKVTSPMSPLSIFPQPGAPLNANSTADSAQDQGPEQGPNRRRR